MYRKLRGFPGDLDGKESAFNVADLGSIPESRRSSGEGNGKARPYTFIENSMDRGARRTTVHRVTNSWTQLIDFHSLTKN